MKLSTKLLLSFFSVAFLVLVVGSGSYYLNKSIKDDLIAQSDLAIGEFQRFSALESNIQNTHLFTRDFLVVKRQEVNNEESESELQTRSIVLEDEARSYLSAFSDTLASIRNEDGMSEFSNQYPEINTVRIDSLIQSLANRFQLYNSLLNEFFLLNDSDFQSENGSAQDIFNTTLEPYFRNTLIPILQELRENRQMQMEVLSERLHTDAENTARIIVFITFIAFIVASLLALIVYRSIARPIKNLSFATEELGAGNLEKRIQIGTHDELAKLGDSFNRMAENLNKSMVSKEYVNNIIQSMGDMLFVTDSDFRIKMVNKKAIRTLGYSEEELIGREIWKLTEARNILDFKGMSDSQHGNSSQENGFRTSSGEIIPVIISYSTLAYNKEKSSGAVFVASNISLQKEAEDKINKSLKEKEVLLAEIHHRVKNNLAVISGLLEMQVWNLQEDDRSIPALKESQMRIQSIALVHELLYQSDTLAEIKFQEYTLKLLSAIEKMHKQSEKKIEVKTDLKSVKLTIQKAIPASLLLNELVVNTFKHAFAGRHDGELMIILSENDGHISLSVQDNGIGLPDGFNPFKQKSLGMTLVKTLVQQINAELTYGKSSVYNSGAHFTIEFRDDKGI